MGKPKAEVKVEGREWSIEERVERHRELGDQIKPLEEERKRHNEEISAWLAARDQTATVIGKCSVKFISFMKESWPKDKLVEVGVTVDQLDRAKVETLVTQLRVERVKEK